MVSNKEDNVKKDKKIIIVVTLLSFLIGVFIGYLLFRNSKGIPFVRKEVNWSIGIYTGNSPFDMSSSGNISNPVLTAKDVTDVPAGFVADPFMVKKDSTWYMFFEVLNAKTYQGDIGLATSVDGFKWTYQQIVLDEPYHLSYPYVFEWNNKYFMIPESYKSNHTSLYKAVNFPYKWSFVATLLNGEYVDPCIFNFNNRWWIHVCDRNGKHDTLRLYHAEEMIGPWREHEKSPIIEGDPNVARPGGRVLILNDRIFRFTQGCKPTYGNQVRADEIVSLTTTTYKEREVPENPILVGGSSS